MNIAMMIPELGGGGAEKVAQQLGSHFVSRGDHVYYFLLDTHMRRVFSVEGQIVQTGVAPCTAKGMKSVFCRLLAGAHKIRALKKQYKIDVSISFMEECNYLNILSQRGEKVIASIHTILSQRRDLNPWMCSRTMVHRLYSLPCKIVVMSRYAVKEMISVYQISERKIIQIPNTTDFEPQKKPASARGNHCVISVARLEPVKQHDRILRAFSYVVEQVEDARLLFVGAGPNERYLKSLCRRYGIAGHVEFTGFQKDIKPYLAMASVFAAASVVEGFPVSTVEAMTCGVPIVTTDSPGGYADILGKRLQLEQGYWLCQYGILTPRMPAERLRPEEPLTEEELILGKALTAMLKEESLWSRYVTASGERAKAYNKEKIFKQWDRIVQKHPRHGGAK